MSRNPRLQTQSRPGYWACGKMVLSDAKKALIMAQRIKASLNVEYKNHDLAFVNTAIVDGVGNIVQLSNIPQGDTGESRDGSNVKITSIYIKGIFVLNPSATTSQYRILLIEDKQTNQAIYATADVLTTVVNKHSIVSPLNLDNQFRFKVLYDKMFDLSITGRQSRTFKIYKKVNRRLRFDGSVPDITDLRSSSYSLLLIGSEATNAPTCLFESRLRFVDN